MVAGQISRGQNFVAPELPQPVEEPAEFGDETDFTWITLRFVPGLWISGDRNASIKGGFRSCIFREIRKMDCGRKRIEANRLDLDVAGPAGGASGPTPAMRGRASPEIGASITADRIGRPTKRGTS